MTIRWKKLSINVVLVVASVTIALFVAEIGLRLFGMAYCTGNWDRNDRVLGTVFIPGAKGVYKSVNGQVLIEINSLGLRDEEFPLQKPKGEKRILVLGDSYVEALQVPIEQTFLKLLENKLSSNNILVINGGHSGYGQAEQLLFWRLRGRELHPDLVVLFFSANDIIDNSIELDPWQKRPYFVLTEDGMLQLVNRSPDPSRLKTFLGEHFYLYHFVRIRGGFMRNYLYTLFEKPDLNVKIVENAYASPQKSSESNNASKNKDSLAKAWRITAHLLKQLDEEIKKSGAEFLVVNTGLPAVSKEKTYFSEILAAICRENNIYFLGLQKVIDEEYAGTGRAFFTDHYSPYGHKVVAKALYGVILREYPHLVSPGNQS
ncbi:MAG: SGNH/GDSL hydrolase family protein [Syntrophobacterales bacterium]|jgi:lysophospholipase L1-like esterase